MPDNGPSRLARAMFYVAMAAHQQWMIDRGVKPGDHNFDRQMEPFYQLIMLWRCYYLMPGGGQEAPANISVLSGAALIQWRIDTGQDPE